MRSMNTCILVRNDQYSNVYIHMYTNCMYVCTQKLQLFFVSGQIKNQKNRQFDNFTYPYRHIKPV